jgi:hypothetical protein
MMARGSGQAGADKNDAAEDRIEVTPEMISAGIAALEEAKGSYAEAQLVERVYIAMRAAAPR